jgi:hypothetical protein
LESPAPTNPQKPRWRFVALLLLVIFLFGVVVVEAVWIRDLNGRLTRICFESQNRLAAPLISMGESARAGNHSRYLDLFWSAVAELDTQQRCPATDDELRLYDAMFRVVRFGSYRSTGLWDNQSALSEFGQGLEEIGELILFERPTQEALARVTELLSRLEAMGFVVP